MPVYTEPEAALNGGSRLGGVATATIRYAAVTASGGIVCGGSSNPDAWVAAIDTCPGDSYQYSKAITPSTNMDLPYITRALYIGSNAGDVQYIATSGGTITLKSVPVGTFIKLRATRILAGGTTSTNIVAFW